MKYLINEYVEDFGNAGSKARRDISSILGRNGTVVINLPYDSKKSHFSREVTTWKTLRTFWKKDTSRDEIIVQFPMRLNKLDQLGVLNMLKGFHSKVIIIHDLESLRRNDISFVHSEVNILNRFDVVISHSDNMTKYLRQHGLTTQVRELYLFDYLANSRENDFGGVPTMKDEYKVFFAGNLEKSLFLERLPYSLNQMLYVYGLNATPKMTEDLSHFMGFVNSDELPNKLKNGWGLVWDGTSSQKPTGLLGKYLAYNAPHKTSLYIAANLPVIVWSGAANAQFIVDNYLGVSVDSLDQVQEKLKSLTADQRSKIVKSVAKFSAKLRSGNMILSVLRKEG